MRNLAFSLIELLVVIAIIGVLAGIAIPAYNKYTIKVKIAEAIHLLRTIAEQAAATYETKGSFPTSITVNGISMTGFAVTRVNLHNIEYLSFQGKSTGMVFTATITGLSGIPGYQTGFPGAYNSVSFAVRADSNKSINYACGPFLPPTSNATDIPAEYLSGLCTSSSAYYSYY